MYSEHVKSKANLYKGRIGERLAARYLQKRGYSILQTNWTCRWGEIDIVAKKDGKLRFVEVKFRSSTSYGFGYEAVTHSKRKKLKRTVQMYLLKNDFSQGCWCFEVVSITKVAGRYKLAHFNNVTF